jgi:di/tripeptidase
MEDRKLQRLKEVLSVPTHSRQEDLMIEYLERVLLEKGYDYYKDDMKNIYVTKGQAENFPCFVAHTDTVHSVNLNLKVVQLEEEGKTILTGIDSKTMRPSGIGGDDKCGVFLCLEMLDKLDNVKVALFVSEEIGCLGSRQADPEFFKNVGYAIQYDSPKGNSMSMTLMGKELFGKSTDFGEKVSPLILEHGITDWARHPYTDIWPLMEKFGFSCLNLAAGYHRYHTDNEYVVVEEVQNAFELGLKLHEILGENFYERPQEKEKSYSTFFGGYSSSNRELLTEDDEDDDLFFDEEDDYLIDEDDEKDIIDVTNDYKVGEFEDFWDYEDFNGGYQIVNYGSSNEYDHRFDW